MGKRGEIDVKKQHGNQTVVFKSRPRVIGSFSIAGKKEGEGPLGSFINKIVSDDLDGEKTHEQAEQKLFESALAGAIKDAGIKDTDVDMLFAGDLLNQIISSSFTARGVDVSFIGVYGACSTMALSLALAASFVDAGHVTCAACIAGSHFATAERQYRTPLELGNQRSPLSQWTVTGAGSTIVTNTRPNTWKEAFSQRLAYDPDDCPRVAAATFGKVVDWGVKDVNNMGAAMAPAAAATMIAHFKDIGLKPGDNVEYPYDAIFTGDLGALGEQALRDIMKDAGYHLDDTYSDCGRLIFDKNQNAYQGGSGCGCAAITLNGFIMDKLRKKDYRRVLLVATGALLSPVSSYQGNTVPGIAHAIVLES